jgi:hypothetical protein
MPGHITRRAVHVAVTPVVRKVGPWLGDFVKHTVQFFAFGFLGWFVTLVSWFAIKNGIPWGVVKSAVVVLAIAPMGFGILVALEQVRLTYETQDPSVYEAVEPFPQRRPIDV